MFRSALPKQALVRHVNTASRARYRQVLRQPARIPVQAHVAQNARNSGLAFLRTEELRPCANVTMPWSRRVLPQKTWVPSIRFDIYGVLVSLATLHQAIIAGIAMLVQRMRFSRMEHEEETDWDREGARRRALERLDQLLPGRS